MEGAAAAVPDPCLDQIFRTARTRNGWSDRPVDDATIEAIYDLAKLPPTSANCNPARFVWVRSVERKQVLAAAALGTNGPKILAAPVTVVIGRDARFFERMDFLMPHAPQMQAMMRNVPPMAAATAQRNTTLQGAYLMLAARALGLDIGPMSGFDQARVDAAFFAGTDTTADFICCLGYGTDEGLFPRNPRLPFAEANTIV